MGDSEKDRELLENLDRILEGRENEVTEPPDDDTRSALEFARKMAGLRPEPSEKFSQDLKARLVHRLSEQEKKQDSGNYDLAFWGVPRRKLWQGTLAALIMVIIIGIIFIAVMLLNP